MNEVQETLFNHLRSAQVIDNKTIAKILEEQPSLTSKKFSILEILSETIQFLSIHLALGEELLKIGGTPIFGPSYDGITSNDVINLEKLYRTDCELPEEERAKKKEVEYVFHGLSSNRRRLLQKVDSFLDDIFHDGMAVGEGAAEVDSGLKVKTESNNNINNNNGTNGGDETQKKGRKRRTPDAATPLPLPNEKKRAIASDSLQSRPDPAAPSTVANSPQTSPIAPLSSAIPPAAGAAVVIASNSSSKKKTTLSFNSADVLFAILNELQKYGVDTVSLDSSLYQLELDDGLHHKGANLSLLTLLWSLINDQEEEAGNEREIPDLSVHMGRTASIVAVEYLKSLQENTKHFDNLFTLAKKESNERFRKRWELLCSSKAWTNVMGKRFALTDVPVFMDRIPNPFGSFGADFNSWKWLTNVSLEAEEQIDGGGSLSQEDDLQSSAGSVAAGGPLLLTDGATSSFDTNQADLLAQSDRNRLFAEEKKYQDLAIELRTKLFAAETGGMIRYFRQCILRAVSVLAAHLNAVIVDKPDEFEFISDSGADNTIVEAIHRSLLVGSLIATFCGQPKPESENKALLTEVKRFRKIAATENHDNWGPILVVCKMTDLEALAAGLSSVVKEFQLEIMPYYGSDNDRMSLRSYLRAVSSGGGMHPIGSGFYSERSHCHIVLISYEALLLDLHYFKEVLWFMIVYDQPWGFFSNSKYSVTFPLIAELLRGKNKIFSSSPLLSPLVSAKQKETQEVVGKGLQLPEIICILPMVCPYFVGIPSVEELARTNPSNASNMNNNNNAAIGGSGLSAIASSYKNYLENKGVLFVNNGNETIEIDEKGFFYLNNLLSAMTVVYDEQLFRSMERGLQKASSLLPAAGVSSPSPPSSSSSSATSNNNWLFPITDMLNLLSLFVWNGAEVRLNFDGEEEDKEEEEEEDSLVRHRYVLNKDSPLLPGAIKPNLEGSQANLVIIRYNYQRNAQYVDIDLELELKQVILSAVGKTGLNVQRLYVETPADPVLEGALPSSGGQNSDLIASIAVGGALSAEIQPMREQAGTGRGRGRGGRGGRGAGRQVGVGRGRGRGRGRGGRGQAPPPPPVVYDPDEEMPPPDPVPSAGGRGRGSRGGGRGRGRGGRKPWKNIPPANPDANRTIGGEELEDDEDESAVKEGGKGGRGSKAAPFTLEEEMSRYIAKRGNVWAASIIVLARQKFLGYFHDEESAKKAFEAAYYQRENGLNNEKTVPSSSSAINNNNNNNINSGNSGGGGSVGSCAVIGGNVMTQGKIVSKFKGKISKDVKLSDGSFIADEFYRYFDEEALIHDIQSLLIPQHLSRTFLSDWVTTYNQPPSYGLLRNKDGCDIHLPCLTCVLGRMQQDISSLFTKLGMPANCANGLIYDYTAPNPLSSSFSTSSSSSSTGADAANVQTASSSSLAAFTSSIYQKIFSSNVCCLHISWDEYIAAKHALIKYNPSTAKFEIKALTDTGIFINGNSIKPMHGFIPLNAKTILQFGREIYIFLLPTKRDAVNIVAKKDNLIALRRNILKCLTESIKLRNNIFQESTINADLKIQKLESLESQTVAGVSLTKEHHHLHHGMPSSASVATASAAGKTNNPSSSSSSGGGGGSTPAATAGKVKEEKSAGGGGATNNKRQAAGPRTDEEMEVDEEEDEEDGDEGDEELEEEEEEDDAEELDDYEGGEVEEDGEDGEEDEEEQEEAVVVKGKKARNDNDNNNINQFPSLSPNRDKAQIDAALALSAFARSLSPNNNNNNNNNNTNNNNNNTNNSNSSQK